MYLGYDRDGNLLPFYGDLPDPQMETPEPEETQARETPLAEGPNQQRSTSNLAERDLHILSTAMMRDKALAAQVRRLGEQLSGDPNMDDKWAAYLYNTARTLEQRKYEEYLRTKQGMMRCKPWTHQRIDKDPPDDDQAGGTGGTNFHIYTILEEVEPNTESEGESEPPAAGHPGRDRMFHLIFRFFL